MKKRVLLTGSGGFIGKNIVEQLSDKHDFTCPKKQELDLSNRLAVNTFFQNRDFDVVIHCANVGGVRNVVDPSDSLQKNVVMFFNILSQRKHFERLIVTGSGAEYGKHRPISNISEDEFDMFLPTDQYGFSKYIMAKYAQNVDYITHLRLFGVFGKYENYQIRFISNIICRALLGLPISINQNVKFDFVYIDDLVKIFDYFICVEKPKKIFYNVGTGSHVDLVSLAGLILRSMGKDLPIIVAKDGMNNEYTCSSSLLNEEISNLNFTKLEEAIKIMVKYYQDIITSIDKNSL